MNKCAFEDRIITEEFTEEFLIQGCDLPVREGDVVAIMEKVAEKFERNYNAVAAVDTDAGAYDTTYRFRVIPAMDADRTEIGRGIQTMYHWLMEEDY